MTDRSIPEARESAAKLQEALVSLCTAVRYIKSRGRIHELKLATDTAVAGAAVAKQVRLW